MLQGCYHICYNKNCCETVRNAFYHHKLPFSWTILDRLASLFVFDLRKYENDLIFSFRFGEDASKRSTATQQEQAKPSEAAPTDTKSSKNSASDTDTSQTAEAKSSTEAAADKETAAPAATNNEMPVPKIKVIILSVVSEI